MMENDELGLLVYMPYSEEKMWHDAFEDAVERGLTEDKAIEYATEKLDAYMATGIYYY